LVLLTAAAIFALLWMLTEPDEAPPLEPVAYDALPGWTDDDQSEALAAFLRSCPKLGGDTRFKDACAEARALGEGASETEARAFFEAHFTPHAVGGPEGLVTGYYEPELEGSRERNSRFNVPVYARPDDLVAITDDLKRARYNNRLTALRDSGTERVPYYTRQEIEEGALAGRGLELLYLEDPVDAFFLHVQGSGSVRLTDGGRVRLGYAGKNGHPYSSIGRVLVERGELSKDQASMQGIKAWVREDPERGRELLWENRSFIFFRELLAGQAEEGPVGAQGVTLTAGRSLAVDASFHALGLPVYVVAPELRPEGEPFQRLMIAQDVGSAIKGMQRGDIFFGTGEDAGRVAGTTRHAVRFYVLLPKANASAGSWPYHAAMTKRGKDSKEKQNLSAEDVALWREVAHSILPLAKTRPPGTKPSVEPAAKSSPPRKKPAAEAVPAPKTSHRPQESSLDRRALRQLETGKQAIEARLDLHGMRQTQAHRALGAFLRQAQANGHRHALIITGRGREEQATGFYDAEERGILRRAVPRWLQEPEFAGFIVSFSPAPRRLGGEGALYVRLRRKGKTA
jgi:membrane-bound lytic murein transglycosylase A